MLLQVSPHKECTVRVTVLKGTSAPKGGTKVKLIGVMVLEGDPQLSHYAALQVDAFAGRGDKSEKMPEWAY